MNILNIFQVFTGDAASVSIPLTLVMIALNSWFLYQLFRKKLKKGGAITYAPSGSVEDSGRLSVFKQGQFWYIVAVTVLWTIALLTVNSDYRPYNPKKDGVPKVQTDSTRISADSMIKLQKK